MIATPLRSIIAPVGVAAAAWLAIAFAAEAAPPPFSGKVCTLVSARVIAAVPDVSSSCTEQPATPAPGGRDYVGTWKGTTPTASLQITIEAFTDRSLLAVATRNLGEGLLSGTPTKVSGVGGGAYEAKGTGGVEVKTTTGTYIAIIVLTNIRNPPTSAAEIEPLARAVVAAL